MKLCICVCQFYQRTPRERIAAVQAACLAAQMPCEVAPDLCYVAAKERDRLEKLADGDVVLACQIRAVRALLGNAGKHVRCIDLRSESLEDIFHSLALTPVGNPGIPQRSIPAVGKNNTGWVPWFPVIDTERCVHCRKCVDFCMFGVYAVEEETVRVVKPESCKTDCPACARICPQNAVIFPKSDEERLNGSLDAAVKPSASDNTSFRERLKHRKGLRLFKEDE